MKTVIINQEVNQRSKELTGNRKGTWKGKVRVKVDQKVSYGMLD